MGVCVIVLIYAHMKLSENNRNKTQMTPSQMTSERRIFLNMGLTPSALSLGSIRCTSMIRVGVWKTSVDLGCVWLS